MKYEKLLIIGIAVLFLFVGCTALEIADGIAAGQGVVDSANEGHAPTTIQNTAGVIARFVPSPYREGLLLLGGIWAMIRGRRHKKALKTTVQAVKDSAEEIGKDAWKTLKGNLKEAHSAKGVYEHVEKFVEKAK